MNIDNILKILYQWKELAAVLLTAVVTLLGIILKWMIRKIKNYFTSRSKTEEWRRDYIYNKLSKDFSDYLTEEVNDLYVPTRFQEERPNLDVVPEEEANNPTSKELIPFFLDTVFMKNNPKDAERFYCVMADTGMGKTTFLVQLLTAYIKKYYNEKSLPFNIFILSLADKDIIEQINKLKIEDLDKRSILLLDALDENVEAYDKKDEKGNIISRYEDFRIKLEQAVARFQFVVITCRTQFFPDEKSELKKVKNARHIGQNPNKRLPRYKQLYISPFSEDDINRYIKKKFNRDKKSKQKAKGIIDNIKSLAVRPLILSYIDDLMDRKVNNVLDAYEIIIDKWLQREVDLIAEEEDSNKQKELLYDFSRKLAVYIYQNWRKTGSMYLMQKEYEAFKKDQAFNELEFSYANKSLITRDNQHNILFAHKSFLEYFYAEQLFMGEIPYLRFEGMDMAKTFFELFCQNKEDKLNNLGKAEKARIYNNISWICPRFVDKVEKYRKKSSAIFKEVLGRDYPTIPFSYNNIGYVYIDKLKSPDTLDFEDVMRYGFFRGNTSLTLIEIPEGVTKIGKYAFYGCTSLISIEIPEEVTEIGYRAFSGCTGLTSIEIPKRVTEIGEFAFYGCTSLASVIINSDIIRIANSAFSGCTSLPRIEIPKSVTVIGDWAFYDCTSLPSIGIPENVTEIGVGAFFGCTNLTSIEILERVTEIRDSAFEGCTSLTSIVIPNSVTKIGDRVLEGCTSLTSIKISEGVTEIGDSAFEGCTSLTSIEIPKGVTKIGDSAFQGCTGLTSIKIPECVTEIGDWAFRDCTGLTSIEIPKGVTKIGDSAFEGCTSLASVIINSDNIKIADDAFDNCTSLPYDVLEMISKYY